MKQNLHITIRTCEETVSWDFGRRFLNVLMNAGDRLRPQWITTFAETNFRNRKTGFIDVDGCERFWARTGSYRMNDAPREFSQDFLWRRRKAVKSDGMFTHTTRSFRNKVIPGRIYMYGNWHRAVDWQRLFRDWCGVMNPQIGMLHVVTAPELFDIEAKNVMEQTEEEERFFGGWNSFRIGSFRAWDEPEIANIGWAMFYGGEFAGEVDEEAIAGAGFPVEKIGGGYLVRVTGNFQDVVDDFPLFSERRAALKSLFRDGLFTIAEEPPLS